MKALTWCSFCVRNCIGPGNTQILVNDACAREVEWAAQISEHLRYTG